MSKKYSKTYFYPIEFKNIPSDKKILKNNIILKTNIEAQGWDLLFSMIAENDRIIIDLNEYEIEKQIAITNTKALVQEQVHVDVKEVSPLFFNINLETLHSKKVAIEANFNKKFKTNYFLKRDAKIKPDSILISSDSLSLYHTQTIKTKLFDLTEIDSLKQSVALQIPEGIKSNIDSVSIVFDIEEFVEKELNIKIEIEHQPAEIDLIIYPEEITLKCLVPISKYENIKASDFYISADFNNIEVQKDDMLTLTLGKIPESVKNIQLGKEKVEYIIYQ